MFVPKLPHGLHFQWCSASPDRHLQGDSDVPTCGSNCEGRLARCLSHVEKCVGVGPGIFGIAVLRVAFEKRDQSPFRYGYVLTGSVGVRLTLYSPAVWPFMPTEKSGYRKKSLQPLQSKGFTLNAGLHFGLSHASNAARGGAAGRKHSKDVLLD